MQFARYVYTAAGEHSIFQLGKNRRFRATRTSPKHLKKPMLSDLENNDITYLFFKFMMLYYPLYKSATIVIAPRAAFKKKNGMC